MMTTAPLFRAELAAAAKALRAHVRALADLAALHRLRRIDPTTTLTTPANNLSAPISAPPPEEKNEQLARELAAAQLELRVAHEYGAAQADRVRDLTAQLDAHTAAAAAGARAKNDLLQQLAATADTLAAVRGAFLACTERLAEIDAERDRFARVAAALRAQNARLGEHVRLLETHARWLADQIENVVVRRAAHE